MIRKKSQRREDGVSRRTAEGPPAGAWGTGVGLNLASLRVAKRAPRRALGAEALGNRAHPPTVSPTINTSECGIVPIGSASMSSADLVTATPSQPPMKA